MQTAALTSVCPAVNFAPATLKILEFKRLTLSSAQISNIFAIKRSDRMKDCDKLYYP
jgi:hypothetical protein